MAAEDPYLTKSSNVLSPVRYGESVTPSDSTDLTQVARILYIGSEGNVKVDLAGDGEGQRKTVTFVGLQAGSYIPASFVSRVYATGTTASSILALW